jgi:hypothetical protein
MAHRFCTFDHRGKVLEACVMVGRRSALSIARIPGVSLVIIGGVVAAGLTSACGARGPLDAPDYFGNQSADGGDEGSTSEGGNGDAAADAAADARPGDAGGDVSNPINCAVCVGQSCSNQILACVTSQSCLGTLQCVFSKCLTGGSVNTACAFGCAGEAGPQGLLDVLAVFQCITTSCGADCNSLLGGLGGGLGGIPGPHPAAAGSRADPASSSSASGSSALSPSAEDLVRIRATRQAAREAFASFPEMCGAIPSEPEAPQAPGRPGR